MYEKYKEMEFVDSDSEEEDNKVVLRLMLLLNYFYYCWTIFIKILII